MEAEKRTSAHQEYLKCFVGWEHTGVSACVVVICKYRQKGHMEAGKRTSAHQEYLNVSYGRMRMHFHPR